MHHKHEDLKITAESWDTNVEEDCESKNFEKFIKYVQKASENISIRTTEGFKDFDKCKYISIYTNFRNNETYKKTFIIQGRNEPDLVYNYFIKYLTKVKMNPEYVFKLFIIEMEEYKKKINLNTVTKYILSYIEINTTAIDEFLL
jgi:hypothetical protein